LTASRAWDWLGPQKNNTDIGDQAVNLYIFSNLYLYIYKKHTLLVKSNYLRLPCFIINNFVILNGV